MPDPNISAPKHYECKQDYRLMLDGPTGQLEALLNMPERLANNHAIALICHPHPQFGGTMQNKVVHTVARAMSALGIPALRFNYRAVGKSEGEYDEGRGETADVVAAANWLQQQWPEHDLWVAGFSFGGFVGVQATSQLNVKQLITVAPALRYLPEDFAAPALPWLNLHGKADEVIAYDDVQAWLSNHRAEAETISFADASHFFHGRLRELREAIVSHFEG